jgi:hypothetical protein
VSDWRYQRGKMMLLWCLQSLTHTEVYYVHLAPLVSSVTHSYRKSVIHFCMSEWLKTPKGKMIHFCMSEWLKTPKWQDERNTLLYEWVTEDTKGLAPLVSSVTHSYRSELRSSCPFGVFSHSLIQKCITFISQSLTHTEVYYLHLVPLVYVILNLIIY